MSSVAARASTSPRSKAISNSVPDSPRQTRIFDIQEPGEQPSANVLYVSYRLGADSDSRSGAQFFQAVDAESFSGRKHINVLAERRPEIDKLVRVVFDTGSPSTALESTPGELAPIVSPSAAARYT